VPVLYFAGRDSEPVPRATLTFLELRGMFGGYETHYESAGWQAVRKDSSCASGCVVAEVTSREGVTEHYPRAGLYYLVGLSPVKVDEVLKFRESYSERTKDAERWSLDQ